MPDEIVNKVAKSGIITLDLADLAPQGDLLFFDLKDLLHEGFILREKEFRAFIKDHDWSQYQGKHIAIGCSTDAIIQPWAYMLVTSNVLPYAASVLQGSKIDLERMLIKTNIAKLNPDDFAERRVVIKGCSSISAPEFAFSELVKQLQPVVLSLMYGEPCSTVPVYKKKK